MNQAETLESVVADQLKAEGDLPYFTVGDTLNVHVRIIEGEKQRIQVFQGVLIADRGRGTGTGGWFPMCSFPGTTRLSASGECV